jgi:hypothetical protein
MARVTEIKLVMHQLAVKLVEAVRKLPDLEWAERYACVACIEEMAKMLRTDPVLAATFKEKYGDATLEALVSAAQDDGASLQR